MNCIKFCILLLSLILSNLQACDLWVSLNENNVLTVFASGNPNECGKVNNINYISSECMNTVERYKSRKALTAEEELFLEKCKIWISKH